jgi:hypothetical protein
MLERDEMLVQGALDTIAHSRELLRKSERLIRPTDGRAPEKRKPEPPPSNS